MSDTIGRPEDSPPLDPQGESILAADSAITAACLAKLRQGYPGQLERMTFIGDPFLSRSQTWGLVWRLDFKFSGRHEAQGINRAVCWQREDGQSGLMMAIRQNVKPLPSATGRPGRG